MRNHKKSVLERIVNLILCVCLLANVFSIKAVSMSSEAENLTITSGQTPESMQTQSPETVSVQKSEDSVTQTPEAASTQSAESAEGDSTDKAPSQSPGVSPAQTPEAASAQSAEPAEVDSPDSSATQTPEELEAKSPDASSSQSPETTGEKLQKASATPSRSPEPEAEGKAGEEEKLLEFLRGMDGYADKSEEELQQVIEELLTKGEFQTKQTLYEFLEEESTTEEFMQELTQKILDGCITENFRKIVEIVRMVQDYSASDILEIRSFVDEILLRYEVEDGEVLLMLEEELPYIYEELEELEGYEDMTGEEKQLYVSKALKMLLESLLNTEIELLNVSGDISLSQYNNGGEIVLDADTTASGVCQLSSGTVTIDLNGHTLTMANGAYFMLSRENAVINIKDSVGGGIIYASRQLIWGYNGGTINLYGGTLDGSKVTSAGQLGGCIWLCKNNMGNHTFNMYGGCIRNFKATQYGGAVYVGAMFSGKKNIFNMYGGTIEDCYAPAGSAVYIDDSGDGPGYFYLKGGTKQSEGGEPKATIRCLDGPNAIYNYGYLGMEGVVDIDGIVYLNQNNWASTTKHFIKITGRLVVIGDGYIDIDSAYPNSNAVCPGHTVVENATQTESAGSVTISQEEFYTYSSYFINTTKGLMVSAGFDPAKNSLDRSEAPANWPTYQGDKYSTTYSYIDVMGQSLSIQSSDSPGDKRQMQNYNYLIYVERTDPSEPYKEYYSIKLWKTDMVSGSALNHAQFQLVRTHDADGNLLETPEVIGSSALTGDSEKGLDDGITYLYLTGGDGKLMIEDGIYELQETKTPNDSYVLRSQVVTLHIYHKISEESGQEVSVVEVRANDRILSTTEQEINSSYHDIGKLVEREIVLNIKNTDSVIIENIDYRIRVEKYEDAEYTFPLGGAAFELQTTDESAEKKASCSTDDSGKGVLRDENGSDFTFSNGEEYQLAETSAPEGYYLMDEKIPLKVDADGGILVNGQTLTSESTVTSGEESIEHGSWQATLEENTLVFRVYDEKKPPVWNLQATKYGTQAIDALRLGGARFTLYRIDTTEEAETETEVISVISSDGTDGQQKGALVFADENGEPLELSCNTTYLLRETCAPMGYTQMDEIKIVIGEDGTEATVTRNGEAYTGASYDAANRVLTLSIVDETVYQMPQTGKGGMYPLLFYSVLLLYGSLMIGIFLWEKNHHNENRE